MAVAKPVLPSGVKMVYQALDGSVHGTVSDAHKHNEQADVIKKLISALVHDIEIPSFWEDDRGNEVITKDELEVLIYHNRVNLQILLNRIGGLEGR